MYRLSIPAAICIAFLAACDSESKHPKSERLTAATVNELLAESSNHGGRSLDCEGDAGGCFVIQGCRRSSDYFSTRMVYSIMPDRLFAVSVFYQTPDCRGQPRVSDFVWSDWVLTQIQANADTGEMDIAAQLVYYGDGFLFDNAKPIESETYRAKVWVDKNASPWRL